MRRAPCRRRHGRHSSRISHRNRRGPGRPSAAASAVGFRPRRRARRSSTRGQSCRFRRTATSSRAQACPSCASRRAHDVSHLGVQEDDVGEVAPGAAEVGLHGSDSAVTFRGEHEPIRLLGRRRRGGEIAVAPGVEPAALEERRRAAEDEIDMTRDERVFEVVAAAIEKDGVLPAEEAAVAKRHAIAVDPDRERLPDGAGGVLERQVLGGEVVGVDDGGGRAERADRQAVGPEPGRRQVVGQDRARGILADERHEPLFALDVDQLAVGPGLDEDDPAGGRARVLRHGVDRLLDRPILPAAVGGNDGVGRAGTLRRGCG